MTSKEREALLEEIKNDLGVPRKVSPKSIERFLDRMKPDSEMRAYLYAYFLGVTEEERQNIRHKKYSSMTEKQQEDFSERFFKCVQNELDFWNTPQVEK
jgi:hypothetical protein